MASHGDIREITYNHPTIGSGAFFAVSAQSITYSPGGYRTDDNANGIASNGDPIFVINQVRGHFTVIIENDTTVRNDVDILARLAEDPLPAEWTVSLLNGSTFRGKGKPVGDFEPDLNTGQVTLKIAGGAFKKI